MSAVLVSKTACKVEAIMCHTYEGERNISKVAASYFPCWQTKQVKHLTIRRRLAFLFDSAQEVWTFFFPAGETCQ